MEYTAYRLSELRTASSYAECRQKKIAGGKRGLLSTVRGDRYGFCSVGGGWILVDRQPEEEGFVFRRGNRKAHAARILGETFNPDYAVRLRAAAEELEREWKASKSKESDKTTQDL